MTRARQQARASLRHSEKCQGINNQEPCDKQQVYLWRSTQRNSDFQRETPYPLSHGERPLTLKYQLHTLRQCTPWTYNIQSQACQQLHDAAFAFNTITHHYGLGEISFVFVVRVLPDNHDINVDGQQDEDGREQHQIEPPVRLHDRSRHDASALHLYQQNQSLPPVSRTVWRCRKTQHCRIRAPNIWVMTDELEGTHILNG